MVDWPFSCHFVLLHISLFCRLFLPGNKAAALKASCLTGHSWEASFIGNSATTFRDLVDIPHYPMRSHHPSFYSFTPTIVESSVSSCQEALIPLEVKDVFAPGFFVLIFLLANSYFLGLFFQELIYSPSRKAQYNDSLM